MSMNGYEPGDIVLKSEPFAYVLSSRYRSQRCDHCLKTNDSLKRCGQCGVLHFCNRLCQKEAWTMHKDECVLLKAAPKILLEFDLLVARVILRLKRDGWDAYEDVMSHRRTFSSLISHVEEVKEQPECARRFASLCSTLHTFLGPKLLPPTQQLLDIFGKLLVNTYGIYDEEVTIIGSGLYLGASILDHSCCPNGAATFVGRTLFVRTLRSIPCLKGDVTQVFISYIDQVQQMKCRQFELKERYFFNCSCNWCSSGCMEVHMTETVSDRRTEEAEIATLVTDLKETFDSDKRDLQKLFERGLLLLGPNCSLGPQHILRYHLASLLFDSAIHLQRWEEAVSLGLQFLPIARFYLGKFVPSVGVVLLKIGKVLLFLERLDQARQILLQAGEVLTVTHGREGNIYATFRDLLCSCNIP